MANISDPASLNLVNAVIPRLSQALKGFLTQAIAYQNARQGMAVLNGGTDPIASAASGSTIAPAGANASAWTPAIVQSIDSELATVVSDFANIQQILAALT